MATRGISEQTVRKYRITTQTENPDIIVFPFYDENGKLQFVKYRDSKFFKGKKWNNGKDASKEWCEKDTKPILFGMAQCDKDDFSRLIITEGQLDSLSLSDCGIKNAVSVPTGAMGFTWLYHCYDWIIKFEEIVVFGDWENGKMSLINELNEKLPEKKIKAVQPQYYLGEKDANDIYKCFGKDALIKAVDSAINIEIKQVKKWHEVKKVDLSKREFIRTNIPTFDRTIGGLYLGQLVLLTGKSGHGKSTLASMLGCEALDQGFKCFFYSGELSNAQVKDWISLQLAGKDNIQAVQQPTGKILYTLNQYAENGIDNFMGDNFYIYDNSYINKDDSDYCNLLSLIESMVCRYDVKVIFIDNLMIAMQDVKETEKYHKQSQFVRKLKLLADTYCILILLVAHQKKTNGNSFDNDDILGSSEIVNRVDLVMSYSKAQQKEDGSVKHNSELVVSKNRLTSDLINSKNPIKLVYGISTKRVVEMGYNHGLFQWEIQAQRQNGYQQLQKPEDPPF